MGRRARERKAARELAEHIVERQIVPQIKAREAQAAGFDLDVAFVNTNPDAQGFAVTCHGCGRTAKLPFDPGSKVGLCPNCIPN